MIRMTTEITLGHKPSERIPEHEWLVDPERIAQPHHVVGPRVELSLFDGAPIATALPAMVYIPTCATSRIVCMPSLYEP